MFLSTLVVYDSEFETKGKKIRVKDEICLLYTSDAADE